MAAVAELTQQIRVLDREIEEISVTRYPETLLLRQVTGVGPITALAYVLRIEDPQRFANPWVEHDGSRSPSGFARPRA